MRRRSTEKSSSRFRDERVEKKKIQITTKPIKSKKASTTATNTYNARGSEADTPNFDMKSQSPETFQDDYSIRERYLDNLKESTIKKDHHSSAGI